MIQLLNTLLNILFFEPPLYSKPNMILNLESLMAYFLNRKHACDLLRYKGSLEILLSLLI